MCSDCEVNDLFLQPVGVDLETDLGRLHLLLILGEWLDGQGEDAEMGNDELGEGHVDECCEEDGEVGGYEVQDEDLLDHCCFMRCKILDESKIWG